GVSERLVAPRRHRVPRPAEALQALAVGVALGAVAGEVVERLAAQRDLELAVGTLEHGELADDALALDDLRVQRLDGERRPEPGARRARAEVALRVAGEVVEGQALLGVDDDRLADGGVVGGLDGRL